MFDRLMVSFVKVLPEFYGSYFGVLGRDFHVLLGALLFTPRTNLLQPCKAGLHLNTKAELTRFRFYFSEARFADLHLEDSC